MTSHLPCDYDWYVSSKTSALDAGPATVVDMKDVDKEALLAERQKLAKKQQKLLATFPKLDHVGTAFAASTGSDVREELEKTTRRITEIDEELGQP
jgi:hypothetical protein